VFRKILISCHARMMDKFLSSSDTGRVSDDGVVARPTELMEHIELVFLCVENFVMFLLCAK